MAATRRDGQGCLMAACDVDEQPGVDLYWIPLGAGAHAVRWTGAVYESWCACREHRPRHQIHHSALVVRTQGHEIVVEQAPAARHGERRGVVVVGPVATPLMAFWPLPRYEIRCWPDGRIDDLVEALEPVRVSTHDDTSRRVLDAVPRVPASTWGRDAQGAGEMWNSNSVIAWVLQTGGVDAARLSPPDGGAAPGWRSGWLRATGSGPPEVR